MIGQPSLLIQFNGVFILNITHRQRDVFLKCKASVFFPESLD